MKYKILFLVFFIFGIYQTGNTQTRYQNAKSYAISQGYKIIVEQYANLSQGSTAGYTKTFYGSNDYMIIAVSDDSDVTDLDVFVKDTDVYSNDGHTLYADSDATNIGVIRFSQYSESTMRVVIKNYSSLTPNYASTVRFLIAHK
jgi:hypothetical protein